MSSADDENLQLLDKKAVKSSGGAESKMAAGSGSTGAAAKTTDAGLKNVRALLFLFLWYFFSGKENCF